MEKILTFLSLLILTQPALAERSWPNITTEPVKIIVTFTPGGAPDILARVLAENWQKDHNNQVIVENKPGAGGNIGTELATKAPANGHTLLIGTVGTLTINPYLYKNLSYDAHKDLEPITFLASTPNVLVLNKNVPASDLLFIYQASYFNNSPKPKSNTFLTKEELRRCLIYWEVEFK